MRHSFIYLGTLALITACGGSTDTGSASTTNLKGKAAADIASGQASGDPCASNAWYGDGTCDSFCPVADTDCAKSGPIVCAAFAEVPDGKCSREPTDPCIAQDPDCGVTQPIPVDPTDPVFCAEFIEVSDGNCSRAPDDPCIFQDPDCKAPDQPPPGGYDCDQSHITCQTFATVPACPDGQTHTAVNNCFGDCVPMDQCAPVVVKPTYDCDTSKITCQTFAPVVCPDGTVPSVNADLCYGPCVPPDQCVATDPVACATYIEAPDGVCSRAPNDPCIFQDPDCITPTPAL